MKFFLKNIIAYRRFTVCELQTKMSVKLNFFMTIIGQLIKIFVAYFLWFAVFKNTDKSELNGFEFCEMGTYIFISIITSNIISNNTDALISYDVRDGNIATNMIRPINVHRKLLFEAFADFFHGIICVALPIAFIMLFIQGEVWGGEMPKVINGVYYFISVCLSFVVLFSFNFCFGILSFYVTNIWGIRNLKYIIVDFLSGAIIPLSFFPKGLERILKFLPFSTLNYYPTIIYLGKLAVNDIIRIFTIQIIWIIILWVVGKMMWIKAVRHLTVMGG